MTFGVLCPGQSAQSVEMLDRLKGHDDAIAIFDAFREVMGRSIDDVIADTERLTDNAVAQPVICAVEMATFQILTADLPETQYFAGYSVGELAAHGCAGTFSPRDVIRLARLRASAMDTATTRPASMIAVRGMLEDDLAAICAERRCYISIRNDDDRFVVAGETEAILEISGPIAARGANITRLNVKVASHTPLMEPATKEFREAFEEVEFLAPRGRVLAGIDGSVVASRQHAIETLVAQLVTPVDWKACMTSLRERGCEALLELLPGSDLTAMAAEQEPSLSVRAVTQFNSFSGVSKWAFSHRR